MKKQEKKSLEIKEIKKNIKIKELKPLVENIDDLGRIKKRIQKFRDEKGDEELAEFLKSQPKNDFSLEEKEVEILPRKSLDSEFISVQKNSNQEEKDEKKDDFSYSVPKGKDDGQKYVGSGNLNKIESFVSPRRVDISDLNKDPNDFKMHKSLMKKSSYPEANSNESQLYKTLDVSRANEFTKNKEKNKTEREVKYTPSEY